MAFRNRVVAVLATIGLGGVGCAASVDGASQRPQRASVALARVEPAEGMERVDPVRPGWCEAIAASAVAIDDVDEAALRMQRLLGPEGAAWIDSKEVARALCTSPDGARVAQQTAYLLQYWVNLTGQAPDELMRFFGFLVGDYAGEQRAFCATLEVGEKASPRQQRFAEAVRAAYGCDRSAPFWSSREGEVDLGWHLDRDDAPPSEMLRAQEVLQCLEIPPVGIDARRLASYAVCGNDARGLDAGQLEQEIAGLGGWAQTIARQHHAVALIAARRYEAAARATAKADPRWQTLLFEVPAKTWTRWAAERDGNATALQAASREAVRGCWPQAWGNLSAYLVRHQPTSIEDATRAITDPVGALLLGYVVACAELDRDPFVASRLAIVLSQARPARGPRWATSFAVLDALGELEAEHHGFAADPAWFGRYVGDHAVVGSRPPPLDLAGDDPGGMVASIARDQGDVVVRYEGTHKPVRIPLAMAGGIAPGVFLRVSTSTVGKKLIAPAFPVEVWKDQDRKKLIAFMGIEL